MHNSRRVLQFIICLSLPNFAMSVSPTERITHFLSAHRYKIAAAVGSTVAFNAWARYQFPPNERWDWKKREQEQSFDTLKMPAGFVFGAATASAQIEPWLRECPTNWSKFTKERNLTPAGTACDGWNLAFEDIKLLQDLGVTAYRFSVSWEKIQPTKTGCNKDALEHYKNLCLALQKAGIQPMITLHHFVSPQWFDELGGFEKAENIEIFKNFCVTVFQELHQYCTDWVTINEPNIYAFMGYMQGEFPPGKSGVSGTRLAAQVLKNMLDAHIAVYKAFKATGKKSNIGLAHSYLKFRRYHAGSSPVKATVETMIAALMTPAVNDSVINYFATGKFEFFAPFGLTNVTLYNPDAVGKLDFFGINFYAHVFLRWHHQLKNMFWPSCYENEFMTDMPYGVDGEGLYDAIKHVSCLNVPIYVTETGCADDGKVKHNGESRRAVVIKRNLSAIKQAIDDKLPIQRVYWWSLLRNYEWHYGYSKNFGLYDVDLKTQQRTLADGAELYQQIARRHNPSLQGKA